MCQENNYESSATAMDAHQAYCLNFLALTKGWGARFARDRRRMGAPGAGNYADRGGGRSPFAVVAVLGPAIMVLIGVAMSPRQRWLQIQRLGRWSREFY